MLRLLSTAAIALLTFGIVGCGGASRDRAANETAPIAEDFSKGFVASTVAVPRVVGLSEGEAVKALSSSTLVANVRYVEDVPRTGEVLRSVPAPGTDVPDRSVVVLSIALSPPLPPPGQEHELDMHALGSLVERHPEAFVGLYRDEAAVPHVVFGAGVDPKKWDDRLGAAAEGIDYPAEGIGYRTDTCSRSRASLRAIQDDIATRRDWTKNNHLAFGVSVQPETCTVRVESDLLTPADLEALVDRHGTAISFNTSEGSHPVPLRLTTD